MKVLDNGRESMTSLKSSSRTESPLAWELTSVPDPWILAGRLADLPHLLFLDSNQDCAEKGRYSFLSADPVSWVTLRGDHLQIDGRRFPSRQVFELLGNLLKHHEHKPRKDLPPFQGGLAGMFGYDLCHQIEKLPRAAHDDFGLAQMGVGLYDWVIAFDHLQNRAWILSTGMPESDPDRKHRRARQRLDEVRNLLARSNVSVRSRPNHILTPQVKKELSSHPGVLSSFSRKEFLDAIRSGIEYVHAGDCFQVNLSQRLLVPGSIHPLDLYGRLRRCNPAPFAGLVDLGEEMILSASPERFLRVNDGQVFTRPIKGTRPRGTDPDEDARLARELQQSIKDRAENVMIVDLLRNDLGRVCSFGTVKVGSLCKLESFKTVHHLVSEINGTLRPGMSPVDLLRAAFPGGSVTGAPKIRAMQIIAELEPVVRGPYCGSLGYISCDGKMDTNILIRSFTHSGGWFQFPVGGGIVADSVPEAEYAETFHKAAGLLRALE